jgi:hypothetical protein
METAFISGMIVGAGLGIAFTLVLLFGISLFMINNKKGGED